MVALVFIFAPISISNKLSSWKSLEIISTFPPPKSPVFLALKVLSIEIYSTISVEKSSRLMFFFSGSFEGTGSPFKVVELYRSPKPRTYTLLLPSCREIPEVFATADATSLTPLRLISCAPICCMISEDFRCSFSKTLSSALLLDTVITKSSKSLSDGISSNKNASDESLMSSMMVS